MSAPLGVFDSGIGGLTVVSEIIRRLPSESIMYVADSAYAPYGVRERHEIITRSLAISTFLIQHGAKALVIACNTATAFAAEAVRQHFPTYPVIAMEPGVKPAALASRTGTVGVLATPGTIASERFISLSQRLATTARILSCPCPGLVELIEAGKTGGDELEQLLHTFIDPLLVEHIDQLVLGCTHYPLVRDAIAKVAGNTVNIVETGTAVAFRVAQILSEHKLYYQSEQPGTLALFASNPATLKHDIAHYIDRQRSITTALLPTLS
jgi:glutamate racemase